MRRTRAVAGAALAVLTLLAYANAFGGGFVLDSRVLILEDPRLRAFTLQNLSDIFRRSYWWPYTDSNLYRPLTTLSYLFNYAVFGNGTRAAGYHTINIIIHVANVLLVYALIRSLLDAKAITTEDSSRANQGVESREWIAILGAALWAVHPLSTEAVTYVMGRADLLATASVLGGLLCYLRATRDRARTDGRWFALAVTVETLGLFAKESAVALPGIVVLYELLVRPHGPRRQEPRNKSKRTRVDASVSLNARSVAVRLGVLLIPVAVYLAQRSTAIAHNLPPEPFVDNPIAHAGILEGRLTALAILGRYLWLAFVPWTLSSDYSYAQLPLVSGRAIEWLAWATVLAVIALTIWAWHRKPLVAFGLTGAFVALAPASNLFFPTGTIMGERLMYLPLAGLLPVVAAAAYTVGERTRIPTLAVWLLSVAVGLGFTRTIVRNRDWQSDLTLWRSAVSASPHSFKAHKGLADALYDANPSSPDWERITTEADRSIAILDPLPDNRNVAAAYSRAAGFFLDWGDALRDATPAVPEKSAAAYARGLTLAKRNMAIVRAQAGPSSSSKPVQAVAMAEALLSTAYRRAGNNEQSLDAAREALNAQPLSTAAYRTLASALTLARQYDTAAVALLTGFMVTGDNDLRQTLIDVYRAGLDTEGCAIKPGANGLVLNPQCAVVHRHLCAATGEAIAVQQRLGRADLVEQLRLAAARTYGCPSSEAASSGK